MLTARTQALILTAGNTLMGAAADLGYLDRRQYATRLRPALEVSQEQWETIAGLWKDLTPPSARRIDPGLAMAAVETRAALHELLQNGTAVASASLIAQRIDLSRVGRLVQQALATNLDLARVTHEATTDPQLSAAARAVNMMATAARRRDPRYAHTVDDSPLAAWVTPRDLLVNRAVPLPDHVRSELTAAAGSLVDVNRSAISRAAFLGTVSERASLAGPNSQPGASRGRVHQDKTATTISLDRAGPRCER